MTHSQPVILIADDDQAIVESLSIRCRGMGLDVVTANDGNAALRFAVDLKPDVICLDVSMPGGNGLSAAELITEHEELAGTPIIMLTGSVEHDTIRHCHRLCANYVQKHPGVGEQLERLISELLDLPNERSEDQADQQSSDDSTKKSRSSASIVREDSSDRAGLQPNDRLVDSVFDLLGAHSDNNQRPQREPDQPPWVLLIEDDRDSSWALKLRLEARGVAVARAFDGNDGYNTAFAYPADVILLDYEMPHGCGDYVLERLKSHPLTKSIPVIMVTGRRERSLKRKLLKMGAAAYHTKPINMPKLLKELGNYIPILPWTDERAPVEIG